MFTVLVRTTNSVEVLVIFIFRVAARLTGPGLASDVVSFACEYDRHIVYTMQVGPVKISGNIFLSAKIGYGGEGFNPRSGESDRDCGGVGV
jgi:hypothetical protein